MKRYVFVFFLFLSLVLNFSALAEKVDKLTDEATHILIAKVKKVESYYGTNKWGDHLIFSKVDITVEKKLKGRAEDFLNFVVEGGTVGDLSLKVSEYPVFTEEVRLKFYLKKVGEEFQYIHSEEVEGAGLFGKAVKPPSPSKLPCCKTFASWPDPNVSYFINPSNEDTGRECAVSDVSAGASAWNGVCGINLAYAGYSPTSIINPYDDNVVFFREDSNGNTIAVTYTWYTNRGRKIIAFDMFFYDGAWNFFSAQCGGSCDYGFYIQGIAIHELGHAIGLDHNQCTTSIMYPYASYCENENISSDDMACAARLYPAN
jgi:hypothetical protein